jgi:hypothetical protein
LKWGSLRSEEASTGSVRASFRSPSPGGFITSGPKVFLSSNSGARGPPPLHDRPHSSPRPQQIEWPHGYSTWRAGLSVCTQGCLTLTRFTRRSVVGRPGARPGGGPHST